MGGKKRISLNISTNLVPPSQAREIEGRLSFEDQVDLSVGGGGEIVYGVPDELPEKVFLIFWADTREKKTVQNSTTTTGMNCLLKERHTFSA
jgi:hypothetical protein